MNNPPSASAGSLLGPDDLPAFEVINKTGGARALLVCDHASNRVPHSLNRLGLGPADLQRHIAWDIGAGDVTRELSRMLDAPAVLAGYSRLVVDCNRYVQDPSCMPAISDQVQVPGNRNLSPLDRSARVAAIHDAYHQAVATALAEACGRYESPLFIAIHSFTPVMGTEKRPWDAAILWDRDEATARRLITDLRERYGLLVGDNEPYSGRHPSDYTVDTHAEAAGLPCASIEIRQDLLADADGRRRWAALLGDVLAGILADNKLMSPRM